MSRSVQEIAGDLKQAVTVMVETNIQKAQLVLGENFVPPAGGSPKIEVRLTDGRVVELGALADELLEAAQ